MFAYPFGTPRDYTRETIELVRQAGFELACVNRPDLTWHFSDRFQIPRLLVRDCDGETFDRWLSEWLGD